MTHEATINKLIEMRLSTMADAFRTQLTDNSYEAMSFGERLGLMVDQEFRTRKNNKLNRLIRNATFEQPTAHIANINYTAKRKIDKDLINHLAGCQYIHEHLNVIILSASGMGKTYLSCALGIAACQQSYTVRYIRLPELLNELVVARGQGIFQKALNQYKNVSLLILDEWMLVSLQEHEARDLLEIINARHKRSSTIFCSQFDPAGWHGKVGEPTIADAILDRIVHDSYTIHLKPAGEEFSMRELYGIKHS